MRDDLEAVGARMRADWDARAKEDAHYYVAFGRRDQDGAEFFSTAAEVLASFDQELKRGLPAPPAERRFLEIGCGPGRLMKPMSERCGEIHGVDVSAEMVERARRNLAAVPNAHAHVGSGATLDAFPDASLDFVYSYAVFQHIPSRDVVVSYWRETLRVLKPGGLARLQINGLPKDAHEYTTWAGVRFDGAEIRAFARENGIQLLALEGLGTQYMWTTWRKQTPGPLATRPRIRRITNAFNTEPVAPVAGRFAALSLWVEGLDERADLNTLSLTVDGHPATTTYLGRAEADGLQQLNALLPGGLSAGLATVALDGAVKTLRLLPRPPAVPRVVSLSDGVDLLSGPRITSGLVKMTVEEFEPLESFRAEIDGRPVEHVETFRVDPHPPRDEINFRIPPGGAGERKLAVFLGGGRRKQVYECILFVKQL